MRFSVEVQKKDDDDHQKRVRFISSNIDTVFTEKGIPYEKVPDIYIVYISRFDVFGENKTIYHISRIINETGTIVENGIHEIYVNTAVDDKSDIAELMQYFKNSVGEHKNFWKLCNRVKYFKEARKGVLNMNQVIEDYYRKKYGKQMQENMREQAIQAATILLTKGTPLDTIAEALPTLSYDFILDLSKKIQDPVNV